MKILIPSLEEMIEINKKIGGTVANKGNLEFLITKIKSKYMDKDFKKQLSKIAAILWMNIIQQHPFSDGNKRSATEIMAYFLKQNNFVLDTSLAGKVYISLKVANNEITYDNLISWLYSHIRQVES